MFRSARKDFEKIALPHTQALYGLAMRLSKNPAEAEDLVQDTMLKAYRFFDRFEPGTHCKAWLYRILTNLYINRYHRGVRTREAHAVLQAEEAHHGALSQSAERHARDPERILLQRLRADEARKALEELPVDFRVAVTLADLEELSYKEIAEVLECPIGTVMSRLYRGRRLLQHRLAAPNDARQPADQEVSSGSEPLSLDHYRKQRQQHARASGDKGRP
jgi:RNA polymerase sigma-70 factor (ECF subfamily)